MSEAFSQPLPEKALGALSANNWDEESRNSAIWVGPDYSMRTGIALNFDEISKQINAYLAKHPFQILGGEDSGKDWFKVKASLKSVNISVPTKGNKSSVRVEATVNGGIEFNEGDHTMDITLHAETGIDVLKIEQDDKALERIFTIILDGTKLKWAGAGWLPIIPLGLTAKVGKWLGYDICSRLVLRSFQLPKQHEGINLPIPSAKELFLEGYGNSNCLILMYARNLKEATTAGHELSYWAAKKKSLLSLQLDSGYLYRTSLDMLNQYTKKYAPGASSFQMVALDSDSSQHHNRKQYKLQLTGSSISIEGYTISNPNINFYIGFDSRGNLQIRARVSGKFAQISVDAAVTVTISADKPKNGVQNIQVTPHVDFASIHIPWWMKLIGFLTGGIAALALAWIVEHLGDLAGKFINEYGTMTIPNTFADYAYLSDVGRSDPDFEWWVGANLMPGTIR